MMTVNEVSKLTGVSIRTLQYYDKIGLLHPAKYTEAGYRLYNDAALETLQQILLFRELEFPLKDIKEIISRPDFDRSKALEQQIKLLTLKKEHIENLIDLAKGIKLLGVRKLKFEAFDTSKIDEYAAQAKAYWGKTPAYKEFEEKSRGRTKEEDKKIYQGMIDIFGEFGQIRNTEPSSKDAQALVKKLQDYITEHMYTCTKKILSSLGKMYAGGGDFTKNIDSYGGEGTAEFTSQAIEIYCR
ncbi:MAG: MerR family transcriptional regulator [Lachnospiraceae bacterium]|jgi:DNA-binding transcriptional MerR regulator|nr:MerR family transcriptional regulator [Lachnospiraceae bacterium]